MPAVQCVRSGSATGFDISGGNGSNLILAGAGDDIIRAGSGRGLAFIIADTGSNDGTWVTAGGSTGGNDIIYATSGTSLVIAGAGNDRVIGGGNNYILGDNGRIRYSGTGLVLITGQVLQRHRPGALGCVGTNVIGSRRTRQDQRSAPVLISKCPLCGVHHQFVFGLCLLGQDDFDATQ
jgi:Ca2+-binding RTX toxin-like protein